MGEPTPKPINLTESGMDQRVNFIIGQPNMPSVFRDERGKIRWSLSGNTPEGNEMMGIRNVQGLFLERFPEFDELFPRLEDGKIAEDKRKGALEYILDRIGGSRNFRKIIGNSPLSIKYYPYFEGSYITIVKKSFTLWGLDFEDPGNPRSFISVNKETGIYADSLGDMWVPIHYFRQKYGVAPETILSFPINIRQIYGRDKGDHAVKLYNMGQVTEQVEKFILHRVKINTDTCLDEVFPQVGKTDGKYTDTDGNKWVVLNVFLRQELDIYPQAVISHCNNARTIKGKDSKGRTRDLYLQSDLVDILRNAGVLGKKKRKPEGYWTSERTEAESLSFYEVKGYLSTTSLRREGRSELLATINKKYPGGMTALKEKLGIIDNSEKKSVSPEDAMSDLMKLLEEEGENG